MENLKKHGALAILALLSCNVNASIYPVEKTKVEESTVLNEGETSYTVQDTDIILTKDDKIKARNWRLKESEYAQYLFIIKYTPRGNWTPDIDPPIALGNEATTDEERMRYASLMNQIEWDRRRKEGLFQLAGTKDIDNRMKNAGYVDTDQRPKLQKGEFSATLAPNKLILRTVFVDMEECNEECDRWVTMQTMQVGKKTQLDLYIANSEGIKDTNIYERFTINPGKVLSGEINISRSSEMVEAYSNGWKTPFVIRRDDKGTSRNGLYENSRDNE